eukprot:TRINITY_DN10323_c0_g1_i3.p1 TRINITY_DN10323_c0_g1~~TRINITY_DN10323_c0_g1_i3.p1  ORF type:complete len:115 (+),score=47.34 TRINITY_DN10323_c0_g1_i3:66-410(+)
MGVDVVAIASQFVELRVAKKNEEAGEFLADDVEWTVPTMMSTETHNGKANVVAFWGNQDKSLPTLKSKTDFVAEGELVATRTMVVSKMMVTATLKQTYTFNADGKIIKHLTVKQ